MSPTSTRGYTTGKMKVVNYKERRERMVREDIAGRGIKDKRVLDAFLKIPREKFVPLSSREDAYEDYPLPIGCGQTISQPYIVALMTEALSLKGEEKVLEIGTGSGYQAAILSELAREVYSMEKHLSLAKKAKERLNSLGYKNVEVRVGDGTKGLLEKEPFDRIIITAGAPRIPSSLLKQLKAGGKMILPLGGFEMQELILIEKEKRGIRKRKLGGCRFVPLYGEEGWPLR